MADHGFDVKKALANKGDEEEFTPDNDFLCLYALSIGF
jgi:hypothetical protein